MNTEAKEPNAQHPSPIDTVMADALPLHAALKTLLDSQSKTGRLMRHLAFFEDALAIRRLKATAEVPIEVLSVAVEQIETLVHVMKHSLSDLPAPPAGSTSSASAKT